MKSSPLILFLLLLSSHVLLGAGCSSFQQAPTQELPQASPTPEPPKKEEVVFWKCKVMNGEGRTFEAVDQGLDVAQGKARQQCETYYRHCTLLSCNQTEEE